MGNRIPRIPIYNHLFVTPWLHRLAILFVAERQYTTNITSRRSGGFYAPAWYVYGFIGLFLTYSRREVRLSAIQGRIGRTNTRRRNHQVLSRNGYEQLHIQAFVAQRAVKTLVLAVLPGTAWVTIQCLNLPLRQPCLHNHFRPVLGS